MAKRFYVDWSDSCCPQIEIWTEGNYADPLTLTEAKREIVDHFNYIREGATAAIARARAVRLTDFKPNQAASDNNQE